MSRRAVARGLGVVLGALVLSGCDSNPFAGRPAEPRPVTLTYGKPAVQEAATARPRELAEALSGVYVRVLIVAEREDQSDIEETSAPGVVTGASGAIIDARGYVITAAHIAMSAKYKARIGTADGRMHEARVVAVAPHRELALLKMRPFAGIQAARLGDSAALKAGDPVLTIGTPYDQQGVVLVGVVRVPRRAQRIQYGAFGYDDAIELSLKAEPGNSGGPLFNRAGELVGIVASFSLGNTNPDEYAPTTLAWAVPSNAIAAYLREVVGR